MRRAALRVVFCSISFGMQMFDSDSLGENIAASMRGPYMLVRRWIALEVTCTVETSGTFWKLLQIDKICVIPRSPGTVLKMADNGHVQ
jgi:exosortase/archaeosortase